MEYKRLYIAYGSNIDLNQMAYRCPNSKVVKTDMLEDYKLEFRGVATIVPKKGSQVPVLLWEIDQRDELNLDKYEGFPNSYRKELFEIEVDGKKVEGMAYLMNYGSISPPSMAYYSGIMKGYRQNNMDVSYLETALKNSYSHFFSDEYESLDVHENIEEDEDFDEAFYAEDNPFQLKF